MFRATLTEKGEKWLREKPPTPRVVSEFVWKGRLTKAAIAFVDDLNKRADSRQKYKIEIWPLGGRFWAFWGMDFKNIPYPDGTIVQLRAGDKIVLRENGSVRLMRVDESKPCKHGLCHW